MAGFLRFPIEGVVRRASQTLIGITSLTALASGVALRADLRHRHEGPLGTFRVAATVVEMIESVNCIVAGVTLIFQRTFASIAGIMAFFTYFQIHIEVEQFVGVAFRKALLCGFQIPAQLRVPVAAQAVVTLWAVAGEAVLMAVAAEMQGFTGSVGATGAESVASFGGGPKPNICFRLVARKTVIRLFAVACCAAFITRKAKRGRLVGVVPIRTALHTAVIQQRAVQTILRVTAKTVA